ncbi:MAG: hypothetical protein HDT41_04340 [Lachnospiraceae bacterium]|nr:hypothetical protein [Lachnospiraceae bacterium]
MYKIFLELDYDKLERDDRYNIEKIDKVLREMFSEKGITKNSDGFYVGGTFEAFWAIILNLSKQNWFIDNLKTWKWYNSDGSKDPEDYAVEDLLAFYQNKKRKQMVG